MKADRIKRVALLGPSAEHYKGGIAQFTSRLAEELEREVQLRFFSWTKMYPGFLLKREFRDTVSAKRTSSVPAEYGLSFTNPLSWVRFARTLKRYDPDLILLTWSHPVHAPVYLSIQWLLGRGWPIQLICHNVLPHESFPGARILTRLCLARCARLIVHGSSEERKIDELLTRKADVLRLFLPLHDFFGERLRRCSNGRSLLFFGNIRAYKGLDVLLKAMPLVRQKIPDVSLTIAGEMFYPQNFDSEDEMMNPLSLVERLGLNDIVTLDIRYIPNEEVPALMAHADVCVFPFRSATQSGGVTLAYAYGLPVVSTHVGSIPDVIAEGETGTLVEPEDPEMLARAIVHILENPIRTEQVDRVAARLSWDHYAMRILYGDT